jgi:hypothetical protein
MNAVALSATRTAPRRGLTARRWLIVLVAAEGVAALCGAVAFALSAPAAQELLGDALGSQAAAAALLLAGLSAVLAIAAFNVTGSLLRDRPMAEASAAGIQATILGGAAIGLVTAGMLPALLAAAGVALAGLLLVLLSRGSARR